KVAAPEVGGDPEAACGAEAPRIVAPGAAAKNPATTISGCHRRAVRRRAIVVVIPAVLHPLPHVAVHVVEAPPVLRETVHSHRLLPVFALGPAAVVRLPGRDRRAPPERRRRAGTRRILPLRLRQQAIGLAHLARQPGQVLLRDVVPRYPHDGLLAAAPIVL